MKKNMVVLLLFFFSLSLLNNASAQCENWNNSPQKSEAEDAHVVYRGHIKEKNFEAAFPNWKKAYELAPAADGQRSFHYMDGVEIYLDKFNRSSDAKVKTEAAAMIVKLYDQWAQCYPKEAAFARGRQAYNMFYVLQSDYQELAKVLKEAVDLGGNKSEYIVLDPYAHVVVYLYQNKLMGAADARAVYEKLVSLADHNIANSKDYSAYFQQGKDAMMSTFSTIEREIFDCAFFKGKYLPQYKADPENREVYREVYKNLVKGGCDKSDPVVYEIFLKDSIATMEEFKTSNPGFYANELYKQGNYSSAIEKYREAIAAESDNEKLASYYFSIASIEFRKQDRFSSARSNALQAAKLRPNWGQPYLLIGDMYAASSSSCGGTSIEKGLAVLAALDKYAYAKAIDNDPEVQSDANNKIARYSAYKPDQGEAFMMGLREGETKTVPCWIGESVKVRFK